MIDEFWRAYYLHNPTNVLEWIGARRRQHTTTTSTPVIRTKTDETLSPKQRQEQIQDQQRAAQKKAEFEQIFHLTAKHLDKRPDMEKDHELAWIRKDLEARDRLDKKIKALKETVDTEKRADDFRRTLGAPHLYPTRSRPPTRPFEQFYSSSLSSTPELQKSHQRR